MKTEEKTGLWEGIVGRMRATVFRLFPRKDDESDESTRPAEPEDNAEEYYYASQWKLIIPRFKKHKVALVAFWILVLIYLVAIFAGFIAPVDPNEFNSEYVYAPPQRIRFFGEDGFHLRPFVYGYTISMDSRTLDNVYEVDKSQVQPIYFFERGAPYKFWGIWRTDLHLFGIRDGVFFPWGADRLGRDVFSRIVHGTRISVSIGLFGVALSLFLGVFLGGISGYFGGVVDTVIQRIIELIRSIPTIPLWMALSAALPSFWPPLRIYFGITIILSLVGWTALARVVRGKFISLREEQFVMAAELYGTSKLRIIMRHMVPSFTSHIIAVVTLYIPNMILAETSLSFLGLGLQPPVVSWGVLLQDAQNIRAVAGAPWLMLPGLLVVITVLAFNFVGDGLRDAADPYND
jgi:peptide/nickel transport system permease protein